MPNDLHTMPLKVEALLSSFRVAQLELDEFGAYLRLLCYSWLNDGVLPKPGLSQAKARLKLGLWGDENHDRMMANVVDEFFPICDDGERRNPKINAVIQEVKERRAKLSEAGKRGAQARLKPGLRVAKARLKGGLSIQSQSQSQRSKEKETIVSTKKKPKSVFQPPTPEEARKHYDQKSYTFDLVKWFSHYESNGWRVGKNPMKSWKASMVTWERSNAPSPSVPETYKPWEQPTEDELRIRAMEKKPWE